MPEQENPNVEIETLSEDDLESVSGGLAETAAGGTCNTTEKGGTCTFSGGTCS
jgi:bacteriocin-like protein